MTNSQAYAAVAEAMAAIDPAETVAQLEENARLSAEVETAIEGAKAEVADLAEAIRAAHRAGPDRQAAARAIMDGGDVVAATKTVEALEERREALHLGLSGLRAQADGLREGRRAIERRLGDRFLVIGDELAPALIAEAKAAIAHLARAYAAIWLAGVATGSGKLKYLGDRLAPPLNALAQRYSNEEPLIDGQPLQADPELANALDVGASALKVARRAVPAQIPFPREAFQAGAFHAVGAAGQRAAE